MKQTNFLFKNSWFLAVLSAGLLRLAFPKFDLGPLAWVGLVPFFMALEKQRMRFALALGWLCGFSFFLSTMYWLVHVTGTGLFVLSAYLGLFFVFFGAAFFFAQRRLSRAGRLVFLPAFWVLLEFIRTHTPIGLPWALLAHSQASCLAAVQVADIGGAYMVSFLLVLVNLVVFETIGVYRGKKSLDFRWLVVPFAVVFLWIGYGIFRLNEEPHRAPLLKASVIQGNIPQEIKWVPKFAGNIEKKYDLLSELARLKDEPDLVIWPETAIPDSLDLEAGDDQAQAAFARGLRIPLLFGSIRLSGRAYFNSALLYDGEGRRVGVYDKIHLVPFGEFLPLRRQLPFLTNLVPIEDFTPGQIHSVLFVPWQSGLVPFGVLICFEDIFPDLASRLVRDGAAFLVNITNDAWFGDTASPYQHMQASVLRAVENRVFVVRAANTGISCVIDDAGRVRARVEDPAGKPTYVTGFVSASLSTGGRRSFYTYFGDVFVLGCLGAVIAMLWHSSRRARRGAVA